MSRLKLLYISVFLSCLSGSLFAQYYEQSHYSGVGLPFFDYSINRQFSEDFKHSEVVVFSQILLDDLTFLKAEDGGYQAELEWLVAVYSSEDKLTLSKSVSRKVSVMDYKKTNSRLEKVTFENELSLQPGEYKFLLRTTDLTTNQTTQRTLEIEIPDFYDEDISISDIMLVKSAEFDSIGNITKYDPILGDNFTIKAGDFYVVYSVYSKSIEEPLELNYKFKNSKNKTKFDSTVVKNVTNNITQHYFRIDKNIFKDNRYQIMINAESDGENASISKTITFFWTSVPNNVSDLDLALNQMVYIINADSLSHYLDADLSAKQKFFKRFWAQRDPNPKTKKNELMDEYFKRINYANEHFSGMSSDGWLTDRGRILIKFGHPEDIERHPFELEGRPYEIWRYYSLRKIFLFEDHTGFGEFRLHPGYISVEYQ